MLRPRYLTVALPFPARPRPTTEDGNERTSQKQERETRQRCRAHGSPGPPPHGHRATMATTDYACPFPVRAWRVGLPHHCALHHCSPWTPSASGAPASTSSRSCCSPWSSPQLPLPPAHSRAVAVSWRGPAALISGRGCCEPLEHLAAPWIRFRPNSPDTGRCRCTAHANGTRGQQVDASSRQWRLVVSQAERTEAPVTAPMPSSCGSSVRTTGIAEPDGHRELMSSGQMTEKKSRSAPWPGADPRHRPWISAGCGGVSAPNMRTVRGSAQRSLLVRPGASRAQVSKMPEGPARSVSATLKGSFVVTPSRRVRAGSSWIYYGGPLPDSRGFYPLGRVYL